MENVKIIQVIKVGNHIIEPNKRCLIELCNKIELIGTFDFLNDLKYSEPTVWFTYDEGEDGFFEINDDVAKLITKIED